MVEGRPVGLQVELVVVQTELVDMFVQTDQIDSVVHTYPVGRTVVARKVVGHNQTVVVVRRAVATAAGHKEVVRTVADHKEVVVARTVDKMDAAHKATMGSVVGKKVLGQQEVASLFLLFLFLRLFLPFLLFLSPPLLALLAEEEEEEVEAFVAQRMAVAVVDKEEGKDCKDQWSSEVGHTAAQLVQTAGFVGHTLVAGRMVVVVYKVVVHKAVGQTVVGHKVVGHTAVDHKPAHTDVVHKLVDRKRVARMVVAQKVAVHKVAVHKIAVHKVAAHNVVVHNPVGHMVVAQTVVGQVAVVHIALPYQKRRQVSSWELGVEQQNLCS